MVAHREVGGAWPPKKRKINVILKVGSMLIVENFLQKVPIRWGLSSDEDGHAWIDFDKFFSEKGEEVHARNVVIVIGIPSGLGLSEANIIDITRIIFNKLPAMIEGVADRGYVVVILSSKDADAIPASEWGTIFLKHLNDILEGTASPVITLKVKCNDVEVIPDYTMFSDMIGNEYKFLRDISGILYRVYKRLKRNNLPADLIIGDSLDALRRLSREMGDTVHDALITIMELGRRRIVTRRPRMVGYQESLIKLDKIRKELSEIEVLRIIISELIVSMIGVIKMAEAWGVKIAFNSREIKRCYFTRKFLLGISILGGVLYKLPNKEVYFIYRQKNEKIHYYLFIDINDWKMKPFKKLYSDDHYEIYSTCYMVRHSTAESHGLSRLELNALALFKKMIEDKLPWSTVNPSKYWDVLKARDPSTVAHVFKEGGARIRRIMDI